MKLLLKALAPTTEGIYTIGGKTGRMPVRALWLHPEAAAAFEALERATKGLVYSDIFRSAEASLVAMQQKQGVQPPGYSAHNFGLAFDVAVDATLALRGWTYETLLSELGQHGWHCHRRDRKRGMEDWHFNFLFGATPENLGVKLTPSALWSGAVESVILKLYEPGFVLSAAQVQERLASLKMYRGAIDGVLGPQSRMALSTFERAWRLPYTKMADMPSRRTCRTLAYVTAERA